MGEPEIVIVVVGDEYWLVEGEGHLDAMLEDREGLPVPVGLILFPDRSALVRELGGGTDALWKIHPGIIARLRSYGNVLEMVVATG